MNRLDFRQNVFGGLQEISSLLPDSMAQQMQAKVARGMIEAMPGGQAILQSTTGALDSKGDPITFDAALRMREGGIDPAQQQYIDAYSAATAAQAAAADRLADAARATAEEFNKGLISTIDKVGELADMLVRAQADAKPPDVAPPIPVPD